MVIFSATSTVRVLQQNGIRVDFQFMLDTEVSDEVMERLQMPLDVPLVAYYKLQPEIAARFKKVLYIVERWKANSAHIHNMIIGTHPTTGNLAVALAVWAKPATLLLAGLDFGFRRTERSHVEGALYDDDENGHASQTTYDIVEVDEINFPREDDRFYSGSYFNNARLSVAHLLTRTKTEERRVYNFSDGARIDGAEPMHSGDCTLSDYPERQTDVQRIVDAFPTDHEKLWEPFPDSGEDQLRKLKEALVEHLEVEPFDWPEWSKRMDLAMNYGLYKTTKGEDRRMEVYGGVVTDLLAAWYRVALLTRTPEEAKLVYDTGLEAFKDCPEQITWPEDQAEEAS
jgi:hypothetical protein